MALRQTSSGPVKTGPYQGHHCGGPLAGAGAIISAILRLRVLTGP